MQLREFAEGKPSDVIAYIARDVEIWLNHNESPEIPYKNNDFCMTGNAIKIFGACEYSNAEKDICLVDGSAGGGKSEALREFKRRNVLTILVTLDVLSRSPAVVLPMICRQIQISTRRGTNSHIMYCIIEALMNSNRLLIFDECHFARWELLEMIRRIHDAAGIGIVLCGQERLYQEMKKPTGNYLWDQISSRIGMRVSIDGVERNDVDMICRKIYPECDDNSLEYLYLIAQGPGKFRVMSKILKQALKVSAMENMPLSVKLLREVSAMHII